MNKKLKVPEYDKRYKGSQLRVYLVREGSYKRNIYIKTPEDVYRLVKKRLCISDREIFLAVPCSQDTDYDKDGYVSAVV